MGYDLGICFINSLMIDSDIIAEYNAFVERKETIILGTFIISCIKKYPSIGEDLNEIVDLLKTREDFSYVKNADLYKRISYEYGFDIPEHSSIKDVSDVNHLIVKLFMISSNRIGLDFFKNLFVYCVKNVPDNSIPSGFNKKDGIVASYIKLDYIPYFIRKFNDIERLNVNNSAIAKVESGDVPTSVERLSITVCDKMESVVVDHHVQELNLSNNPKLNKVVCKFSPSDTNLNDEDSIHLDLSHCPEIKSGKNINVTAGAGSVTITNSDILPQTVKAPFELSKKYSIDITIGNSLESFEGFNYKDVKVAFTFYEYLINIKSFYGLANPSIISFYSSWKIMHIHDDETIFNKHFSQIKNAYQVFNAYIDITKAYPDLLTDPTLGSVYKMYNPTSLKEFETLLRKIKSYNADLNYISLLTNLLLK